MRRAGLGVGHSPRCELQDLEEAGDAVVLEPDEARQAVLDAAGELPARAGSSSQPSGSRTVMPSKRLKPRSRV